MMENALKKSDDSTSLQIKVCGLTRLEQIHELIQIPVDFLGFIFYEKSPRFVLDHLSLKQISEISHPKKVGVFVNESIERILEIVSEADLDFIQLHGDEDSSYIKKLKLLIGNQKKLIKVVRIGNDEESNFRLLKEVGNISEEIEFLLFDTDSKAYGGTGNSFDWEILNLFHLEKDYFLSGGVSDENYHRISLLKNRPSVLDINSKFELSPGNKDLEKIRKFIKKIKTND